ncbi:hypothetical protein CG492_14920 [Listeria monocytogenes]|nr:hypothetical protein [Listeria monocytogenes]EAC8000765.1 hypothetical protein [Listeria monocytogenes]EAC9519028.1 hypothetical protein [Listeria monocytogenes]EAD9140536.1 hypothetical protein [Listeria monocytogenes]EAF5120079.1 hypothetical protein [Listeria monocytogenes]
MELLEYFFKEVNISNPYYQFREEIENGQVSLLEDTPMPYEKLYVSSSKEAINKFRSLTQPQNVYNMEDNCKFILICHYLYQNKYVIEEFPELLENPVSLSDFAYGQVRTYLIAHGVGDSSRVAWQDRRNLVNTLKFKILENFYVQSEINQLFLIVSTRSAEFQAMTNEEKLKEIANLLEYLLKDGKKFITLDTETIYCGFISNEQITAYRKKIQCFRHSSVDSLAEREFLKDNIEFLISYGLAILAPLKKDNNK